MEYKKIFDNLGIWISGLCLIHCVLMPVFIIFYPFMFNKTEEIIFHSILLIIAIILSLISFKSGYKIHQKSKPIKLALTGISLMFFNLIFHDFFHDIELLINLIGSLFIISAHLSNKKHCSKCKH